MVRILKIKVNLENPNPKKNREKEGLALFCGGTEKILFSLFKDISYEFLNLTILKGFCDKNQKRFAK